MTTPVRLLLTRFVGLRENKFCTLRLLGPLRPLRPFFVETRPGGAAGGRCRCRALGAWRIPRGQVDHERVPGHQGAGAGVSHCWGAGGVELPALRSLTPGGQRPRQAIGRGVPRRRQARARCGTGGLASSLGTRALDGAL